MKPVSIDFFHNFAFKLDRKMLTVKRRMTTILSYRQLYLDNEFREMFI